MVSSGGVAVHTAVSDSGLSVIAYGGLESFATVSSGGTQVVLDGGVASATTLGYGAMQVVSSGGTAIGTDLLFGGAFDLQAIAFASGGTATLDSATKVLTISEGGSSTSLQLGGSYAGEQFQLSADSIGGTVVAASSTACYCRGTLILTGGGERPVQLLAVGDVLVTANRDRRAIKWVGRRSYGGRFLAANPNVQPIRFRAGSLGDGLPRRDLLVSPEHAMFLDGLLIPARCLLNGATIVQERGARQVDYFHVEFDSHDVLLAEGVPSESFLNDDSRGMFHNAAEFQALYPETPRPGGFCARRVTYGAALETIRQRLALVARTIAAAA